MKLHPTERILLRLYGLSLLLYPPSVRRRFGRDMRELFADLCRRERSKTGLGRLVAFIIRSLADVTRTALRAHGELMLRSGRKAWRLRHFSRRNSPVSNLMQDLRFAVRSLKRNPLFALVAMATLALGIGANSGIFSVVNAVLLKPLPYQDPDRLVTVWSRYRDTGKGQLSPSEYLDFRDELRTVRGLAAWTPLTVALSGGKTPPQRIVGAAATAELFPALGVDPLLGRVFGQEEDQPGKDAVALLGETIWQTRFGGDPDLVGKLIEVNGIQLQVLGILPGGFRLTDDIQLGRHPQIFVPLGLDEASIDRKERGWHYLNSIGRMAPDATEDQVRAEVQSLAQRFNSDGLYPPEVGYGAFVIPARDEAVAGARQGLWLLLAAVGLLLLIACVNVANLMLARADARRREIAIRGALGAGRMRLLRQVMLESLVLSTIGGVAGLALAHAFCAGLAAWHPVNLPRLAEIGLDITVLAFTLAVSLLAGLLCGCAPAWQAWRPALGQALQEGPRGSSSGAGRQPVRGLSVVAQVALSVVLVLGAGLMLRSLWSILGVDPGIKTDQVLSWRLSLPRARYDTPEKAIGFFDQLREGLSGLPGVVGSGAVRGLPLTGSIGDWDFEIEGRPLVDGQEPQGDWQVATPGYFETMQVRLVKGRFFNEGDRADSLQVALVNQTLARQYWPDENPVGQRIKLMAGPEDAPWATIVGVIGDIRQMGLGHPPRKEFYCPHSQFHRSTGITVRSLGIVVRAEGDLESLAGPIRQLVGKIDPAMPLARLRPMNEVLSDSVSTSRFLALMLAAFAAVALALAGVGIYGLLSYWVSRSSREIGIRMALGADRRRVLRMVVGRGLAMALLGVAAGTVAALALTRFIQGLLFQVAPHDPITFIAIPIVMLALSVMASYLPSRRATGVDPMTALRAE